MIIHRFGHCTAKIRRHDGGACEWWLYDTLRMPDENMTPVAAGTARSLSVAIQRCSEAADHHQGGSN